MALAGLLLSISLFHSSLAEQPLPLEPEDFHTEHAQRKPSGRAAVHISADGSASASTVSLVQSGFERKQLMDPKASHEESFLSFVHKHKRGYGPGSPEFHERFAHFRRSLAVVEAQNARPNRLWDAGVNELSDWSPAELKQLLGWRGVAAPKGGRAMALGQGSTFRANGGKTIPLPTQFLNWTRLHTASDVADQGACGSCWAVATATVLQAHVEISSGSSHRLSAQQLVSCVANPMECGGAGGCQGATVELALAYVTNHGLTTEHQTPYRAVTGSCQTTGHQHSQRILAQDLGHGSTQARLEEITRTGVHNVGDSDAAFALGMRAWEKLPENSMEHLMRAVVEHGPVAVSVGADGWNSYNAGVFDGCLRDNVINHAVTLLGYGVDAHRSAKYWTIQNSWGPGWGENGHMRLLRHDNDSYCGTDYQPEMGTACRGGPSSVRVCGMCGILYDSVVPHFTA